MRKLIKCCKRPLKISVSSGQNTFKSGICSTKVDEHLLKASLVLSSQCWFFFRLWPGMDYIGQSINKEYYGKVLKRLLNAITRKQPQLWETGDWLLHHDNATAHASNLVQQFLLTQCFTAPPASIQSRYSFLRLLWKHR